MSTKSLLDPARDKGGSIASGRLDYQKDWSLCKMLDLHESGADYIFLFEHDDDLMILLTKDGEEHISFYQVKTKELGDWSVPDLVKKIGKTGHSILGRLYLNKLQYKEKTTSLNLVSNARYKTKLASGKDGQKMKEICVSEINDKELKKIVDKLSQEHSLQSAPDTGIMYLRVDNMPVGGSGTFANGRVSEFLNKLNPNKHINASLAYTALFEEVRRRCNYADECKNIEDLKKYKAISRSDFADMLKTMNAPSLSPRLEDLWDVTQQRLNQDGYDMRTILDIKHDWIAYDAQSTDHSDETLNALNSDIKDVVKNLLKSRREVKNIKTFLDEALQLCKASASYKSAPELYTDTFIMAIILDHYYEQPQLQKVNQKSG